MLTSTWEIFARIAICMWPRANPASSCACSTVAAAQWVAAGAHASRHLRPAFDAFDGQLRITSRARCSTSILRRGAGERNLELMIAASLDALARPMRATPRPFHRHPQAGVGDALDTLSNLAHDFIRSTFLRTPASSPI